MTHLHRFILTCVLAAIFISCRRDAEPATSTSAPTGVEATPSAAVIEPASAHGDASAKIASTSKLPRSLSESQKIEALIAELAKLEGATFVRNGKRHTVDEAISHMRMKWKWKASEIKTAEEFIRVAATKSSTSGERYMIIFAGGEEIASADWFRQQLQRIDAGH